MLLLVCLVGGLLQAGHEQPAYTDDLKRRSDPVPDVVRTALRRHAGGKPIERLQVRMANGVAFYKATLTAMGYKREVVVTGVGDLVERRSELDLLDVPMAVREAVEEGLPPDATVRYQRIRAVVYEANVVVRG